MVVVIIKMAVMKMIIITTNTTQIIITARIIQNNIPITPSSRTHAITLHTDYQLLIPGTVRQQTDHQFPSHTVNRDKTDIARCL